jgi:pSer/pThr/pTyr-binding forkhead associated (FHA) protein
MDYRFNKYIPSTLYFTNSNIKGFKEPEIQKAIIKLGRESYDVNDIKIPGGTSISRRHCVIINFKDDVWLYDLNSNGGTYMNGNKIIKKTPLIGRNTIQIGNTEYELTNDKSKLF